MLNEIAKDISDSVERNVKAGINAVIEKYDPQIKEIDLRLDGFSRLVSEISKKMEDFVEVKDGEPGKDGVSITMEDARPVIEQAIQQSEKAYIEDFFETFIKELA